MVRIQDIDCGCEAYGPIILPKLIGWLIITFIFAWICFYFGLWG